MFCSKEMINRIGYESVEKFVSDYSKKYDNCCVRYVPDGVYIDCDFNTQPGVPNIGFEGFKANFCEALDANCIKSNTINDISSLFDNSLTYSKTYEEEFEEQRIVSLAENYLESLGIKVRTDMYGYYRHTYDILLDLGKYLSKNNK